MSNQLNQYREYIACLQIAERLYAAKLISSEDYSRVIQKVRQRYMVAHRILVKKPQTTGHMATVE